MNPAVWILRSKEGARDISKRLTETSAKEREPSHGIPEADLTEEQREAAARRIKDEDAIRRARGK